MKKIRKWAQRRRILTRLDWLQLELELSYDVRTAGNGYLERLETFDKRRARLTR